MSGRDEAREALGAARALVAEWAEEGVESWPREAGTAAATHGEAAAPVPEEAPAPAAASEPAAEASEPVATASEPVATASEPVATASEPVATASEPVAARTAADGRPTLEEVREVLGDCTRCRLHEGRTQIVFGDGNPEADLMFVGEGPGEQEDLRGIPFCGRAGELLTSMIEKGLEIPRSSVYICNIVKCRPPGNRNPMPDEVSACRAFLDGQIEAIAPKVIVTLGKPAATTLLGREVAITKLRGTWQEYKGTPLMPTLHPAYLLRQYTPENRRNVWNDLKAALDKARE